MYSSYPEVGFTKTYQYFAVCRNTWISGYTPCEVRERNGIDSIKIKRAEIPNVL